MGGATYETINQNTIDKLNSIFVGIVVQFQTTASTKTTLSQDELDKLQIKYKSIEIKISSLNQENIQLQLEIENLKFKIKKLEKERHCPNMIAFHIIVPITSLINDGVKTLQAEIGKRINKIKRNVQEINSYDQQFKQLLKLCNELSIKMSEFNNNTQIDNNNN